MFLTKASILLPIIVLSAPTISSADDDASKIITNWSMKNEIIISPIATEKLLNEYNFARERLLNTYKGKDNQIEMVVDTSMHQYLDNLLNSTSTPEILSLAINNISPGGLSVTYPKKYPILTLQARFTMSGVVINRKPISFVPTFKKRILLNIGRNTITTIGGNNDNCSYLIITKSGQNYSKTCPE